MQRFHNIGEESGAVCAATVGITPEGEVFPIRCKSWACPVCAPINAYMWAIVVANGVAAFRSAGAVCKFVTITQPPSVKTASFAYEIIHSQWDKFRGRWRRWAEKAALPFDYAAFVEGQSRRDGMPHFHIIAPFAPPKKMLKDWATSSGFGYQCDIQPMGPTSGAAWYVSKYSTKSSDAALMPKYFRRVRLSEDWPRIRFRADEKETLSIIKGFSESYVSWAHRASLSVALSAEEILGRTLMALDSAPAHIVEPVAEAAMYAL